MAKIEDLIAQISDERLRKGIAAEVKNLKRSKKFGLVFEEHLPEMVRLPEVRIKIADVVTLKGETSNKLWRVIKLHSKKALCTEVNGKSGEKEAEKEFEIAELTVVRNFGDPIYPSLVSVERIERHPEKPWHLLINSDNYHALQLLLYSNENNVDVIYIDPPYNTGARDWKYNNNYVDKTDSFRHSKWLSMMKKRLSLAKKLLKPDGVMIITIDVNELHRLSMLLDEIFPEYLKYMVNIVINPKGVSELNFARIEEQALFLCPNIGRDVVLGLPVDYMPEESELTNEEWDEEEELDPEITEDDEEETEEDDKFDYQLIRRRGTESRREDRPSMFYPIFIDEKEKSVVRVGEPIELGISPSMKKVDGLRPVWPINKAGMHGRWQVGNQTMQDLIEAKEIVLGSYNAKNDSWTINRRVPKKIMKKLKTVWRHKSHDAGTHGTVLLSKILGKGRAFSFPKSLYAVRDCLTPIVRDKKNAVILDFFAGSGTTYHATALINSEDGGSRRCILVTNNEVNEEVSDCTSSDNFGHMG